MLVTALNDADATAPALAVATDAGSLRGLWRGLVPIRTGETVDVELEIGQPRRWSDLAVTPDLPEKGDAGKNVIRGRLVEIYEDGVVALQIEAAAVMLEMIDGPAEVVAGTAVSLIADDLEFHPTGI
jgi:hypothetical protein